MDKQIISAAAAMAALFSAAAAQDTLGAQERQFDGVDSLIISNFTGRIEVAIGGDRFSASMSGGSKGLPVEVSQNGAMLTLEAPERARNYRVHKEINWRRHGDKAFGIFLADYPVLKITAPEGAALELEDAITIASVGDLNGALLIDGGYVDAIVGNVATADVGVHGSGDILLGAVSDDLKASVHGSGDIDVKSAGASELSVHGSGDIRIGEISGETKINVHGSGDIATGDIGGDVKIAIHGSGDVDTGAVENGAVFSIHGSGDIAMRSINGPAEARIRGSGNIDIGGGRAENLKVSVNGSGDFAFDGVSTNLAASVHGSGFVTVARNEGRLTTSGRGDVRVNGQMIEIDD